MGIIIGLLILFFCPVIILGIAATAFGMFGLIGVGALCVGGLLCSIRKLVTMPDLCKKVGIYGMAIFLIITSPLPFVGMLYRIPFVSFVIPALTIVLKCVSPYLLLTYSCGGLKLKHSTMYGTISLIMGTVYLVAMQIAEQKFGVYAESVSIMMVFVVGGVIMLTAGFILLLREKSLIAVEENRGINIILIGVIINILLGAVWSYLRAVSLEYLSFIKLVSNIPFIIMLIGFIIFLSPIWKKYYANK